VTGAGNAPGKRRVHPTRKTYFGDIAMPASPAVWGALLAAALGGAVAGNALGSAPILDRSTLATYYQEHADSFAQRIEAERPPDHYPLVTAAGTVPVAELSTRGLYSQARYRAPDYSEHHEAIAFTAADYRPDQEHFAYQTTDASLRTGAPEPGAPDKAAPASETQMAAAPKTAQATGQARLIDVQASLAMP
jgi:hypothetical protein